VQFGLPLRGHRVEDIAAGVADAAGRQELDVPLHQQGLVDLVAGGEGVLQEMVRVARVDLRAAP